MIIPIEEGIGVDSDFLMYVASLYFDDEQLEDMIDEVYDKFSKEPLFYLMSEEHCIDEAIIRVCQRYYKELKERNEE